VKSNGLVVVLDPWWRAALMIAFDVKMLMSMVRSTLQPMLTSGVISWGPAKMAACVIDL
jgi:hypothetical protein